jgi:hypothetical protein
MNSIYKCCELIMIIIGIILTISLLLSKRDVDENGMDSYDRMWGIAREGYMRNHWGQIHRDSEYDFWANLVDHNPYFNH